MYALDLNTLPASDLGNTGRSVRSLESRPMIVQHGETPPQAVAFPYFGIL
jgi:hypothetical protein